MKGNFMVRLLMALLVLAIFGAYSYYHISYTPFSGELDAAAQYSAALNIAAVPDEQAQSADPAVAAAEEAAAPAPITETESASEAAAAPTAEPTPEPTVDPESPAGRAAALGLPAPPDIDVTSWEYVLVNGTHSIDQYEPEQLAYLNQTADSTDIQTGYNESRCPVDIRIAQPLLDMALACKEAGLPVYLSSGYRSYYTQGQNFIRVCQNNGVSDGKNYEGYYITMPAGCSEHQTGLGVDITDRRWEIKNDQLDEIPTIQWLAEHCKEYGFILRFPKDKRAITEVMGESWHFRYVGPEAAAYIMDNNLCLEEFLALYGVE